MLEIINSEVPELKISIDSDTILLRETVPKSIELVDKPKTGPLMVIEEFITSYAVELLLSLERTTLVNSAL